MTLFFGAVVALTTGFHSPAGAFDRSATAETICHVGYASAHRRVPFRLRNAVYNAYGLPRGSRRGYVIDHFVPLELGGTNAVANLWPQTRSDAHRKNQDEDRLHFEVCSGSMTIDAARAEIERTWRQ